MTPQEMLRLGVFGGKYITDSVDEFPSSWFVGAKLSARGRADGLNYFGVHASQSLSVWRRKGLGAARSNAPRYCNLELIESALSNLAAGDLPRKVIPIRIVVGAGECLEPLHRHQKKLGVLAKRGDHHHL